MQPLVVLLLQVVVLLQYSMIQFTNTHINKSSFKMLESMDKPLSLAQDCSKEKARIE